MKVLLYSINIGNYDHFRQPPKCRAKSVRKWLFSDYHYSQSLWDIKKVISYGDDKRTAGKYIIKSHELGDHDISILMGGQVRWKNTEPIDTWARKLIDRFDIVLVKHPQRNCVYKEGQAIIRLGKDNSETVQKQLKRYLHLGIPPNSGMYATALMIRKNNQAIKQFESIWYDELKKGSKRDQMGIVYALRKSHLRVRVLDINTYDNPLWEIMKHR